MIYASLWHGASVSSVINKWIFAKKQPAAARNGYLIVRIRLLEVLPTCWRYCEPPPFYDSEKGGYRQWMRNTRETTDHQSLMRPSHHNWLFSYVARRFSEVSIDNR